MIETINSIFNTREQALIIWLLLLIPLGFLSKKVGPSLIRLVKAFFQKRIILLLLFCWVYIGVFVYLAYLLDIWHFGMTKDTITWMLAVIAIMMKTIGRKKDSILSILKDAVQPIIVFEFIVNMKTYSLGWEFILVPVVTVVYGMMIFSEGKDEFRQVYKFMRAIVTIWGLYIIGSSFYFFISNFNNLDGYQESLNLILPIWLTVIFIPCLYLIRAYSKYEQNKQEIQ